jgi:phosphatidylserine/phosphatidylglycerophosphate/cardiolipin synthase-like enzyme
MPFVIDTQVTCYLLPQDGGQAKADFLAHLMNPGETWITAYAFTLPDMIHDLLDAHQKGIPLHIYLDHTQETGKAEQPLVQQLVDAGVEVTMGTSPAGSKFICRTKGIISDAVKGGAAVWCWEGSTNFSLSAWQQVNTAMVFSSQDWRNEFVAQWEALRDFARAKERNMQLMSQPPADTSKAPTQSRVRNGFKGVADREAVAGLGGHASPKKASTKGAK